MWLQKAFRESFRNEGRDFLIGNMAIRCMEQFPFIINGVHIKYSPYNALYIQCNYICNRSPDRMGFNSIRLPVCFPSLKGLCSMNPYTHTHARTRTHTHARAHTHTHTNRITLSIHYLTKILKPLVINASRH